MSAQSDHWAAVSVFCADYGRGPTVIMRTGLVDVAVRRYIDILIIIITFPYSSCISFFLAAASLLCSYFKCFFVLVYVIFVKYSKRCSKNILDRSKIEITRI